jgi:hypothetical protein
MNSLLVAVGAFALVVILFLSIGVDRQRRSTSRMTASLLAMHRVEAPAPIDVRRHDSLPAPVARYLAHVLPDGWRPVAVARFRQVGELRPDIEKERWSRFEATQTVVPPVNGFVWNAQIGIAPLLHVRVLDAYVGGEGSGRVSLLSALTVAREDGRHELSSGSLHRYLAEAVWYPTALWPSAFVQWTAVDDTKALATLTDGALTVSLDFCFNDADEVTGIYSPARWGRFGGDYVQAPWEGHFRSYEERDGMLVPTEGEVGWYSSGTWQSVWRGKVVDASYEFARHIGSA